MRLEITADRFATKVAEYLLKDEKDDGKRAILLNPTKYNVLVKAFNASTVLLVAAAVSAVFFAFTSAFVLGAAGILVRHVSEKELSTYLLPTLYSGWDRVRNMVNSPVKNLLNQVFQQATKEEKIHNIFSRVGQVPPENWGIDDAVFIYPLWKNTIPLPNG